MLKIFNINAYQNLIFIALKFIETGGWSHILKGMLYSLFWLAVFLLFENEYSFFFLSFQILVQVHGFYFEDCILIGKDY